MATLADIHREAECPVRTGTDDITPSGTFYATTRILGIITNYLVMGKRDDPTATVIGRIEYPPAYGTSRPTTNIYHGGGIKGGTLALRQMSEEEAYKWMLNGWHRITSSTLTPLVTISDLVKATGLSRRSVRDLIRVAGIQPIPGFGDHGAISYELSAILAAIANMPGKGHRRLHQSTSQNGATS